jgi:cell wall-associated NlpC family hydrolase
VGAEVTPVVEALRPGDILLFSMRAGAGVTHVGMYTGDAKFIHSATEGVKLSRLDPHDPDGAYWMAHWVGARRVIP